MTCCYLTLTYRRPYSNSVLETRINYVESRLDDTINSFKDAMQQMENRHQTNFTELKATLDMSIAKAESSRRWVAGLVITVALTIIGFVLTNGFQIPA